MIYGSAGYCEGSVLYLHRLFFFKSMPLCHCYWHEMVCISALNWWLNTIPVFSTMQFWCSLWLRRGKWEYWEQYVILISITTGSYSTQVLRQNNDTWGNFVFSSYHSLKCHEILCCICMGDVAKAMRSLIHALPYWSSWHRKQEENRMLYLSEDPLEEEYKKSFLS